MKIFVFGSSITSSYWNGAATYYRGCYKYLARRGHQITFAEPDAFGRQQHRDAEDFSYVNSIVYAPAVDLEAMLDLAASADVIIKHSGIGADDEFLERQVLEHGARSAIIFWDVDAPATVGALRAHPEKIFRRLIPCYDAVFTYGGGPSIRDAYRAFGARAYCSIYNGLDPETHYPVSPEPSLACDLAFLGNRLPDREARVEELFLGAAELVPKKRFLLGGEGWGDKALPSNVLWIGHVPTAQHNLVNCSAGMVMNINRSSMAEAGFSPPTRVFEVAGSGSCLLCDHWPGMDDCFMPGTEILTVRSAADVADALSRFDEASRRKIGEAFRARSLRDHTYEQRAVEVERGLLDSLHRKSEVELESEAAGKPA